MKHLGTFLLIFTVLVEARYDAKPTQSCEAYNNMKHTRNTHHVLLDTSTKYTVLKHHKGQNLILVKGETPAQRWVDDECFSKTTASIEKKPKKRNVATPVRALHKSTSKQNLLALSWQNAFCETHRYKKECKRGFFSKKEKYTDQYFGLHGLWPQPRNNLYCDVDKKLVGMDKNKQWRKLPHLGLDNSTEIALEKVMPGYASGLHKHEWIKHGTCYGTDANTYYAHAIKLVMQFNASKVGSFFAQNLGKKVTLKQVRHLFDKEFGYGTGSKVEFKCKKGLITELWLHLGSGSSDLKTLLSKGKNTRSRCHKGLVDRVGY